MDRRFIRAVETSMVGFSRFWHVLVYDQAARPIACACYSTLRADPAVIGADRLKRLLNAARRVSPRLFHCTVLFNGLPVSAGQKHLVLADDVDARTVLEFLDPIARGFARCAGAVGLVYKHFGESDRVYMDHLLELGYRRAETLPMFSFARRFRDFDEYLGALRHHYRQQIRQSQRRFAARGYRICRHDGHVSIDSVYTPELHRLYEAVVGRSSYRLERLPREFFVALGREFADGAVFTVARKDDRPVAFIVTLHSDAECSVLLCGRDYSTGKSDEVYFNMVYHALDLALRSGCRRIDIGQTAAPFKLRLGCEVRPLYLYVKVFGPLLAPVFRATFRVIFPKRPPSRGLRVFRDTAGLGDVPVE